MGVVKPMQERLNKYIVNDQSGCWEWIGAKDNQGYGRVGQRCAHRVSYEFHIGPIPDGLYACHTCDNTSCINPQHIFLGTHQDNIDDKVSKNRCYTGSGRQGRQYGELKVQAKITDDDVRWIRDPNNKATNKELCEIYGISSGRMSDIRNRKAWTHV